MILFLILFAAFDRVKGDDTSRDEGTKIMRFGLFVKDEIISLHFKNISNDQNTQIEDIEYDDQTSLLEGIKVPISGLNVRYYYVSLNRKGDEKIILKLTTNQKSYHIILENNNIKIQKSSSNWDKNSNKSDENEIHYLIKTHSIDDNCNFDCILDEDKSVFNKLSETWEIYYHSIIFEQGLNQLNSYMWNMYNDFCNLYTNNSIICNIDQKIVGFDFINIDKICNKTRDILISTDQECDINRDYFLKEIKDDIKSLYEGPKAQLKQLVESLKKNRNINSTEILKNVLVLYSELYSFKNLTHILQIIYDYGVIAKRLKRSLGGTNENLIIK